MKNFKDNQKVKHPKYGEGEIVFNSTESLYYVDFYEISRHWSKIGDDFYNQLEEVEDLPEVGEYAYFWDEGKKHCAYALFVKIIGFKYQNYIANLSGCHLSFSNISKTPPKFD